MIRIDVSFNIKYITFNIKENKMSIGTECTDLYPTLVRSTHGDEFIKCNLDIELIQVCRSVTGCLKPTNI